MKSDAVANHKGATVVEVYFALTFECLTATVLSGLHILLLTLRAFAKAAGL